LWGGLARRQMVNASTPSSGVASLWRDASDFDHDDDWEKTPKNLRDRESGAASCEPWATRNLCRAHRRDSSESYRGDAEKRNALKGLSKWSQSFRQRIRRYADSVPLEPGFRGMHSAIELTEIHEASWGAVFPGNAGTKSFLAIAAVASVMFSGCVSQMISDPDSSTGDAAASSKNSRRSMRSRRWETILRSFSPTRERPISVREERDLEPNPLASENPSANRGRLKR
jgi:hypothetical protein